MPQQRFIGGAQRLRQLDPDVPIIGVTANALREEGEHCLKVGMNAWLVKPLNLETLRQTLAAYSRQRAAVVPQALQQQAPDEHAADLEGWITLSPAMHRLFVTTMQEDLAQAEQALEAANTSTLVSYLHRINGSLATVGAQDLATACSVCEITLLHEPLNSESASAVEGLLKRLHAALLKMVEGALYPNR